MSEILGKGGVNFDGKRGVNAADPINDKDVVNLRSLRRGLDSATANTLTRITVRNLGQGFPVYKGFSADTYYFRSLSAGTNLNMISGDTITFNLNGDIIINGLTANTITAGTIDAGVYLSGGNPIEYYLHERLWCGSTGVQSIIRNNYTNNLAYGNFSHNGAANTTSFGSYSFVGAGRNHYQVGAYGIIVGGLGNYQNSGGGFIGGGSTHRTTASYTIIVGGFGNKAYGVKSIVVGGHVQKAYASYSFVGGGRQNNVYSGGGYGSILNGLQNNVNGVYSSILGGKTNNNSAGNFSVILNGLGNATSANFSTVLGGQGNNNAGEESTIVNGSQNVLAGTVRSTILNGLRVSISANYSLASGYYNNINITNHFSTILNGMNNQTNSSFVTILNGRNNNSYGMFSIVAGDSNVSSGTYGIALNGKGNIINGNFGTVLNGESNQAGIKSVVLNGNSNNAYGTHSLVLNGQDNQNGGIQSLIGNGTANRVDAYSIRSGILLGKDNTLSKYGYYGTGNIEHSLILAGQSNKIVYSNSLIGTGLQNKTFSNFATILNGNLGNIDLDSPFAQIINGNNNKIYNACDYGTVLNGYNNKVTRTSPFASILGGSYNTIGARSDRSVIVQGYYNTVSGTYSSILNGSNNFINSASKATILNGSFNINRGNYSSILAGTQHYMSPAASHSAIIGGIAINAISAQTVYMPHVVATSLTSNTSNVVYAEADGHLQIGLPYSSITFNGIVNIVNTGGTHGIFLRTVNSTAILKSLSGISPNIFISSSTTENAIGLSNNVIISGLTATTTVNAGTVTANTINGGVILSAGTDISQYFGDINLAANTGGTHGWYTFKSGRTLVFKSLSGISPNIVITSSSTENAIGLSNNVIISGLTATTNINTNTLTANTIISNLITANTINANVILSAGTDISQYFGDVNLAANTGGTHGIFVFKSGRTLVFKSLSGVSPNIVITSSSTENAIALSNNVIISGLTATTNINTNTLTANTVISNLITANTINANVILSAGTDISQYFGDVNLAANTGGTHGIFVFKSGRTLVFKSLSGVSPNIIITSSNTENAIALSNNVIISGLTATTTINAGTLTANTVNGGVILSAGTDISVYFGDINLAVNTGGTHGIFSTKSNKALVLKSLSGVSPNILITSSTTENAIGLNPNLYITAITASTGFFSASTLGNPRNLTNIFAHSGHTHPLSDILNGSAGDTIRHSGGTRGWTAGSFLYNNGSKIGINATNLNSMLGMRATGASDTEMLLDIRSTGSTATIYNTYKLLRMNANGLMTIGQSLSNWATGIDAMPDVLQYQFGEFYSTAHTVSTLLVAEERPLGQIGAPVVTMMVAGNTSNSAEESTTLWVRGNLIGNNTSPNTLVMIEDANYFASNNNYFASLLKVVGGKLGYARTGMTISRNLHTAFGTGLVDSGAEVLISAMNRGHMSAWNLLKLTNSATTEVFSVRANGDTFIQGNTVVRTLSGAAQNFVVSNAVGLLSPLTLTGISTTNMVVTNAAGAASVLSLTGIASNNILVTNAAGTISAVGFTGTSTQLLTVSAAGLIGVMAVPTGVTTNANIGNANPVYAGLVGSEFQFRTLVAGSNISITTGATTLTITASATTSQMSIQNGLNTTTGGTAVNPTVNVSALTIDHLTVSGDSSVGAFTATTISSGQTDIGNIFATINSFRASAVTASMFAGAPYKATIVFVNNYANANYGVSVVGQDERVWTIEDKAASGFTISSNSNVALTGNTEWTTSKYYI